MNCKNCGSTINENDKFCGVCGTKLNDSESKQVNPDNNLNNREQMNNQNSKVEYQPNNQNFQNQNYNNQYNNGNAVKDDNETACLICGIISFFTCWLGIILGIVAIVLGAKVKKTTGKTPAGMICGIISLSIYTLLILVYIAIFAFSIALGV